MSSSNYQTSYQSAYSVPSISFKSLSVKHDAHGDRVLPASQQDLIQVCSVPDLFCPITLLCSAAQHARAVVASHQTGNAECASVSVIADHVKQSCYHASAGPTTSGIIAPMGLQSFPIPLLAQSSLQRHHHAAVHVTRCISHGCKVTCRLCHQGLAD